MERSKKIVLQRILAELNKDEKRAFTKQLVELKERYQRFPFRKLKNVGHVKLADLLLDYYGKGWEEVTVEALRNIERDVLADVIVKMQRYDERKQERSSLLGFEDMPSAIAIAAITSEVLASQTSEREQEETFFEKHQEEIIRRAVGVDIVLDFLEITGVITFDQLQEIQGTDQQRIRKLYELMPRGKGFDKEQLERILTETNGWLITQLQGGHFVDRHQEELIERVTEVPLNQLRGLALDEEEYETLLKCAKDKMQMQALFQMEVKWSRQQKDQLYQALAEKNRHVIEELEEEHFIEKHQEELIHRVFRVDAILRRLPDQCSLLKEGSDEQKMEHLYTLVPKWNRKQKDNLYMVLKKTNGPLIAELEEGHFIERHKEYLIQRVERVTLLPLGSTICHHLFFNFLKNHTTREKMEALFKLVPNWNGEWKDCLYRALKETNEHLIKELEGRRCSKDGLIPDPLVEEKCYLCSNGKGLPEEEPEPFVPEVNEELKTYRIHLPKAGIFLCSITELKFEVKAAVTIEYAHGSWDEHLSEAEMQIRMVAGPLFSIQADAEEKVAAVHLPHFLCLQGGEINISDIEIAHFVDEGMMLEKPARVTPFHAVLKNPKFSLLGVLLNASPLKKLFPIHSVVQLYQARRKAILHLYLIPNDSSLIKAIEDREKSHHSKLIQKHPQTDEPLYIGSRYVVFSLSDLNINPKELEFSYKNPRQLQSFVEVYLGNAEKVNLSVKRKTTSCSVWDAWLHPEDMLIEEGVHASGTEILEQEKGQKHFIELHRERLIQRAGNVEGILDILYGSEILDEEQYQRVLLNRTNQEKMRELYCLVPTWNRACKDKLYSALEMKNKFLVQDLEES